ncbi:DUF2971 domain-containing protein [Microbacterium profundi]|uniref:DUF2971 domain-containing protein n=1 Tax=Microbacterium profundi TaxID=450380 RepID=UPI00051A1265|nr:DUF2971 domain-containing protein [Microbacterium profundi]
MDIDLTLASPSVPVGDDVTLWRYLDFPKFLDLLASKALKMPRASSMEDPFEGVMGDGAMSATLEVQSANRAPSYWRHAFINKLQRESLWWRDRTYVSCWNAFPSENAGLWRIYGDEKGVAIRTTWGSLRRSFAGTADCVTDVFYGPVSYRSAETDFEIPPTYTDQYFVKRQEFSHEKEFRLMAHDESREHDYRDTSLEGLPAFATLPCDLNVLIEEIVISPRLGGWVQKTVEDVSRRYGGTWPVTRSNLYRPPPREIHRF